MRNAMSFVLVGTVFFLQAETALADKSRVKGPPLPSGSERIKHNPGEDPKERARDADAHRRPIKNKQRDDGLSPVTTAPVTAIAYPPATSNPTK